ncbi:MAG: phosphoenolpyruvate--protein phosphotransferase [Rhizobiales bacterium]|nr:phosphoenolpyruvate--protein phosphotransferase [Hyphomicrobiales bacterium]
MERSTIVRVHEGLHARPATRFVKLAKSFECDIEIAKDGKSVSAKSSVKLMLLGVKENDAVTVRAEGADAIEALEVLIGYLENPRAGIEESEPAAPARRPAQAGPAPDPAAPAPGQIKGVAASEGLALGPAFPFFPAEIRPGTGKLAPDAVEPEIARYEAAVAAVQERMAHSLAHGSLAESDRGIIAALKDIASDETLRDETLALVRGGLDAVSAVLGAASTVAQQFAGLDDPYMNARADDVHAISRQICLTLLGQEDPDLETLPEGAILIAEDIGGAHALAAHAHVQRSLEAQRKAALRLVELHRRDADVARTHGIPAVLGLGDAVRRLKDARLVAVDGSAGIVHPDPASAVVADMESRIAKAAEERRALDRYRDFVPRRGDGTVIEVAANLGAIEEIEAAQEAGAMGIGLFRTELLFMKHIHLPSEDMQMETYSALLKAFPSHAVIVRTLDIGGDKPVSGIDFPHEENPFLGWRGVRMCLDRPDIFKPQLRALLRAAVHGNLKVMLPMVSDVDEVRATKVLIAECERELDAEGKPYGTFGLGVMIETPATVFAADQLAQEAAFFSIGTNDLTQYVMAADRLNPTVAKLNDVRHPAVMTAIEMTAKAAVKAGIMVGMCGEAAGRPDLIAEFIRMGLTELSMSPASIPRAKKTLANLFGADPACE